MVASACVDPPSIPGRRSRRAPRHVAGSLEHGVATSRSAAPPLKRATVFDRKVLCLHRNHDHRNYGLRYRATKAALRSRRRLACCVDLAFPVGASERGDSRHSSCRFAQLACPMRRAPANRSTISRQGPISRDAQRWRAFRRTTKGWCFREVDEKSSPRWRSLSLSRRPTFGTRSSSKKTSCSGVEGRSVPVWPLRRATDRRAASRSGRKPGPLASCGVVSETTQGDTTSRGSNPKHARFSTPITRTGESDVETTWSSVSSRRANGT